MTNTINLNLFQSANANHESIKNSFIVRKHEFEVIVEGLLDKKQNDPIQHELILGRRGSGKSTLLKRIEIEIQEHPKLAKKYIAINLAEEQAGIYRLFDLWEQIIAELSVQLQESINLNNYTDFNEEQAYTNYLYQIIHQVCKKHKKRVVLLLDNFDRIVENLTDDGHALREVLINYKDIAIIAGSTRMEEHFWHYDKPFYEFFRRHRLAALSSTEIRTLLENWSDTLNAPELKVFATNNSGKIENIRILTDGLPRTLQFFIQIVLQDDKLNAYEYLKKIMDNVSPLYQERLNTLSPQQRKIVLETAFFWEACSTKQLAEKCRMESKLVSANLKTLEEKGVIEKLLTDTKNHLYRISERFFNMWLIVTQGNPEQKRQAKWLSLFLENWYDEHDFKNLVRTHLERLQNKALKWEQAVLLSKGLCQSKHISTLERDMIILSTEEMATLTKDKIIELPRKVQELKKEIFAMIDLAQYDKALKIANSIENEADGMKFTLLALVYTTKGEIPKAKSNYLKAIQLSQPTAFIGLGRIFVTEKKYAEAEELFMQAIDLGLIEATTNLGKMYYDTGRIEEAEKIFLVGYEYEYDLASYNLGYLYKEKDEIEKAIQYYKKAIEWGNQDAIYDLGLLYKKEQKYNEAETMLLQLADSEDSNVLIVLANIYVEKGKIEEAKVYYQKAIKLGDSNALVGMGVLLKDTPQKALKYFKQASDRGNVNGYVSLALTNYLENQGKSEALQYIYKYVKEAESNFRFGLVILIEIWNGIFEQLPAKVLDYLKKFQQEDLSFFLLMLLVHQQANLMLELFHHPEIGDLLQNKYKPDYYVTQILANKKAANLKLIIPPELKGTIEDILENIAKEEKRYGYRKD